MFFNHLKMSCSGENNSKMSSSGENNVYAITEHFSMIIENGPYGNSITLKRLTKNGSTRRLYINMGELFEMFNRDDEVSSLLALTSLGETAVKLSISRKKFLVVKCYGDYERPIAELKVRKGDEIQPWSFYFTMNEWKTLMKNKKDVTRWLHNEFKNEVKQATQYKWMGLNSDNELIKMSENWDFVKMRALLDGSYNCLKDVDCNLRIDERKVHCPTFKEIIIFTIGVMKRDSETLEGLCFACAQAEDEMFKLYRSHHGYNVCVQNVDLSQLESVLKSVCVELSMKYTPVGAEGDVRRKLTVADGEAVKNISLGWDGDSPELISMIEHYLSEIQVNPIMDVD